MSHPRYHLGLVQTAALLSTYGHTFSYKAHKAETTAVKSEMKIKMVLNCRCLMMGHRWEVPPWPLVPFCMATAFHQLFHKKNPTFRESSATLYSKSKRQALVLISRFLSIHTQISEMLINQFFQQEHWPIWAITIEELRWKQNLNPETWKSS